MSNSIDNQSLVEELASNGLPSWDEMSRVLGSKGAVDRAITAYHLHGVKPTQSPEAWNWNMIDDVFFNAHRSTVILLDDLLQVLRR